MKRSIEYIVLDWAGGIVFITESRLRELIELHGNDPDDVFETLGEKLVNAVIEASGKIERMCKLFLSQTFFRPFDLPHGQLFEVIDDDSRKKVVVVGPRGIGKSSILSTALPMQKIIFSNTEYFVPIAENLDTAISNSLDVKNLLALNELIDIMYGGIKFKPLVLDENGVMVEGLSTKDTQKSWVTSTGVVVTPKAPGVQLRGLRALSIARRAIIRPTLYAGDDLEKTSTSDSDEQRLKTKRWFFTDLINTIDASDNTEFTGGKSDWRFIVLGTKIHEDGLIAKLMDSADWEVVVLKLWKTTTVGVESNFPNYISTEGVKSRIEEARNNGTLGLLHREMQAEEGSDEEGKIFLESYFKYFNANEASFRARLAGMLSVVIVDPARSNKLNISTLSDTGVVAVSFDVQQRKIYVRMATKIRCTPTETYEFIYETCKFVGTLNVAVEVTGLHMYITQPLTDYFKEKGLTVNLIELQPRMGKGIDTGDVDKINRIKGLGVYYKHGMVVHDSERCTDLINQLRSFPFGKKDVADAFAYFIYLMNMTPRLLTMRYDNYDFDSAFKGVDFREESQVLEAISRRTDSKLANMYMQAAINKRYGKVHELAEVPNRRVLEER